jgi:VCBS repeat-containing protein
LDSHSTAQVDIDSLSHHGGADTVTIPDAHLLFGGDYERSGADLIVSDHDHRVVVPNYFQGDKRPTLVSPDGAPLDPKVIEALTGHVQYAQASGAAAAAKVVGHVIKMTGSASVVRNGVTVTLNDGDNVLQNDVVQTGSGSTLGLVMIDGTTFNLSAGARLMLNDLTYDANSTSNTSLFTLVQGAASFVAGQVAKTGDMKVGTPVATMGIRGTAVSLDIAADGGRLSISVIDQRDGQVHSVQVFNARGILIGTVTSNGSGLTLTPIANFEVIAQASDKSAAQIAQEFNAFQTLLQTYDAGRQLFPNLPQHTDNANPNNTTQHAGSPGLTSPATEYHSPNGTIPGSPPAGSGTPVTVALSLTTDSASIGSTTPPADPVVVQVVVPATPLPFVVTPPTISRVSSGGGDHFGPVMSADGQYIVYDPDGAIYLYDRQSNTTITIAAPGGGFTYSGQTISADGHHVVFQGTDGTNSYVFIYNNDPSDTAHYQHTIQLVAGGAPAISGDGSTIVVEHGGNSIGIYDQQGHAIATITPAAIGASGTVWRPAISADGHMIAFWSTDAAAPGGSGHLFTYNLSTGIATEIASAATDAGTSAASFSADGRYVVYQSDAPGGHSEIYLYDLSTGEIVFSTANPSGASYNPVISPDGHFIIFASDAHLTDGDTNAVTDTYVVDVTDPNHPIYTLVSNLANGTQPDAASNLGAAISAGGLFIAFGSSASNLSQGDTPGTGDIFVVDATSGRSAIIQERANSPAILTADGVIALTGDHNGVTLGVSDPTGRFTASFDAQGNIEWHFSEPRSDFAALLPGQISTQNFVITLSNSVGTTTIPVRVSVYDAYQPTVTVVDAAPHAAPVALAQGTEDTAFTITPADLLAGVADIDTPLQSLLITDVTIRSGGGTLDHNQDGTWTYTPAPNFNGAVVFDYTVSDGSKTASSTASLNIAAVNDDATISGQATGNVVEDGSSTISGSLTVHDVDSGEGHFQAVPEAMLHGTYGNFTFDEQTGAWTYALVQSQADSLSEGQVVHDTLAVKSADGTAAQLIDVTITGSNDAATITGPATASLVEDSSTTASGSLAVQDVDSGEGHFRAVPEATLHGTYGNFTFNDNTGIWTYALVHSQADSLTDGQIVHDTLTVKSADGTATQLIDVTITGSNDAPVAVADTGVSITQNGAVDVSFSPILNASATGVGSEYIITQAINSQAGALWSNSKVSLNTSFTISADLFFGANDGGADGFSFIIQNQSQTLIGASGGGLGYQGIANSVAIEFDTYDNGAGYNDITNDHAAFDTNGSMSGLGAPIDLGNIEDGQYHPVTIAWNAATHVITLSYNGAVIGSQTIDVAAIVGSGEAYIGFAGSTGGLNNLQMIRDLTYQSADNSVVLDVLVNDTDVDAGDRATLHVVSATSAGGARVTFSGLPGAGIVYSPSGVFDYLAAGQTATDTVTYTIQDSHGAQSTTTAQVTINGLNDAPTLTATAANPTFTEAPGLGTQAAPVPMFSGAHSSTIDAGQAITGLTFNVSGLVDGVNERVIVDGTTIALGSASTGSTSSGLTYRVAIAGGTATVALSSAGGISAAAADTLVNSIAYQDSSADAPTAGDRTFTLTQVTDNGGTLNTTALSIASTVHLVAVNDAPVNSVPGAQTVAEDTAKVFGSATGNAISISDVDVGAGNETVTVAVTNGALTLAGTAGLSFSMGDGTADTTMTFSGTVGAINTALNGLNYVPTANFNGGATLTVTTNDNGNTGGGSRTDIDTVAITVTPVEDAPAITGTTATGSVPSSALTVTAASYLTAGSSLVNGLGGAAGFGDTASFGSSPRSDDGSTSAIDLTHVFGASGLNFFGHTYTSLYINNNGNVTFAGPISTFTPTTITAGGFPIIAPFWADVDTRNPSGLTTTTPGGHSTGSDLVYYSLDSVNHVVTITWDDVGYFNQHDNLANAFQLQLIGLGNGDFDIVFRYEAINWTTGDSSGGSGGLAGPAGTPARAGYSAGDGNLSHYFEIPGSGIQSQVLALDTTTGNTGIAGVDVFQVQSGNVTSAPIANGTVQFADPDNTDTHTASFTSGGTGYHGTFTLDPVSETGGNGSVAWHFALTNVEINNIAIGVPLVQNYTIAVNDGHAGITTQTVSVSVGSSGTDTLNAGHAADVLIGAGGSDNFAFSSTSVGNETIVDFTHGADLLQISVAGAGFAGHGLVANAAAMVINAASIGAASSGGTSGDFIFDTAAHSLYWDANGGSGADAVLLAHLQNVNSLSASDFHLV